MQKSLMLMPYGQMVGAFGRRVFKEMRASFFCSRNPDVQNFIHPECSKYEKDFNLSLHSIILGDLTSDLDEKTMSILRGYGKRDARSVGCYLIGQLVRDDSYSHSDISGNEILREVLTRLSYVRNIVGGRFVAIDCVKELIPFYERNGFVAANQHADLFTMIMPITPLRTMDFAQLRCGRNASQEKGGQAAQSSPCLFSQASSSSVSSTFGSLSSSSSSFAASMASVLAWRISSCEPNCQLPV